MIPASEARSHGVSWNSVTTAPDTPLIPGMRNQNGKLAQIAKLVVEGWSGAAISKLTRCSPGTVRKVVTHLKWKGIPVPPLKDKKCVDGKPFRGTLRGGPA